jgi:signal transduction histidine kinase
VTDYEGMKHVFFNLLLNALEASPPKGQVLVGTLPDTERMILHIDDHGPGLPAAPTDIFAPFYTSKKNGTGLGLTVCRKIIEAHGGSVSLEDRPGGGCRATVSLPRRSSP